MTKVSPTVQFQQALTEFSHFWLGNPLEGQGRLDKAHDAYRVAFELAHGNTDDTATSEHVTAFTTFADAANDALSVCLARIAEWRVALEGTRKTDADPEAPAPQIDDQLARIDSAADAFISAAA